jgi:peptidyl-prolyl cis-trans isomerase A (cyclophilin A)
MKFITYLGALFTVSSPFCSAQIYADFKTTSGDFTCELNYLDTPRTVGNFVSLAEGTRAWVNSKTGALSTTKPPQPYYNGITFHRVVKNTNFKIIQAGSQKGDGNDGPGYTFRDEINEAIPNSYKFDKPYYLAMANSGPNTNGSQFFITGNPISSLEKNYTVFGKVISGQPIIDSILSAPVGFRDKPISNIVINSVTIRRIGKPAIKFSSARQSLPVVLAPEIKNPSATLNPKVTRYKFKQPNSTILETWISRDNQATWKLNDKRIFPKIGLTYTFYDQIDDFNPALPTPSIPGAITNFRAVITKYPSDFYAPYFNPARYFVFNWSVAFENANGKYVFNLLKNGATYTLTTPGQTVTSVAQPLTRGGFYPIGFDYEIINPHLVIFSFQTAPNQIIKTRLALDTKIKKGFTGRQESTQNGINVGGNKPFTMTLIK